MFGWARTRQKIPDSPGDAVGSGQSAEDLGPPALDSLAAVLRALGRFGFDLELQDAAAFERECEAWARHALIAAAPPGRASSADGRRDWRGLQQFVLKRRREERAYVLKTSADVRQIVWTFVQGMQEALARERQEDERLADYLDRLRRVDGRSTEEIKREVATAVGGLTRLVEERKQQQESRLRELGARVHELGSKLQEAKLESATDGLTRLYNRRALDEYLAKVVYLREAFGHTATLLLVDLDGLKQINDLHGHLAGDAVLKSVSDCLVRNFPRRSDMIARFGGDEFAVVLRETRLHDGKRLGDRLVQAVRSLALEHDGASLRTSVSVGVAELGPGESIESWIRRTDHALYEAKRSGSDRIVEALSP